MALLSLRQMAEIPHTSFKKLHLSTNPNPVQVDMNPIEFRMTKEQKIAMKEALLNPLVLHKLMGTLDFPELKLSRLVNKTWKGVSSEVINKRDCCQICLTFDEQRNVFRRSTANLKVTTFYSDVVSGSSHLGALNQILKKSIHFPCTNYRFQGGNLGNLEPQKFFNLEGLRIKTLELYGNSQTSQWIFHDILVRQAPNVQDLCTYGFPYKWSDDQQLTLPSLKIYEWCHATDTGRKILLGARNLEIVKNFRNCDTDHLVIESGKVFGIHSLDCHVNDKPETWTRLVNAGLQLKKLTFRVRIQNPRLSTVFQQFLNVSKDTLKFLELSEVCARFGTQLPILSELQCLEMGFNSGQHCFPIGTNLSQIFPKLRVLDCSGLLCHNDDQWRKYFPGSQPFTGSLPTVEILKICDDSTQNWMQRLGSICPNFKKLFIQSEEDNLENMLRIVFQLWPQLTHLNIKFSNLPDDGLHLDSAFTGMTIPICDNLWSLGLNQQRPVQLEQFKVWPSIVDLKDLKSLQMTLACSFKVLPLTFVSAMYGFSLIPDLKTLIEFDHNADEGNIKFIYQEMGHFVNIRHKKCPLVDQNE